MAHLQLKLTLQLLRLETKTELAKGKIDLKHKYCRSDFFLLFIPYG